ncbi:MAG TPA: class I SAM-dependent methyltransferase [Chthoniobacterales bacterium]
MKTYYEDYWSKNAEWSPSAGGLTPTEKKLLLPLLKPKTVFLDYGCGDGRRYGKTLTELGVDYRGFDVSSKAVEDARADGVNAALLINGFQTSLADESCEVAACFEVLEHLMEPDLAVREILRCLAPDGTGIFSVPNAANWFQRMEFALTGFWNPGGSPLTGRRSPWRDPHIRFFSPTVLRRLLLESGFAEVQLRGDPFSLKNAPYFYRAPKAGKLVDGLSWPLRWLGLVFPSLFSTRIFAAARKTSNSQA